MGKQVGIAVALVAVVVVAAVFLRAKDDPNSVTIYATLDKNFSQPILQAFEDETGIKVNAVFDGEATKSVGLRVRVQDEADRPRCDVFWSNEPANIMILKKDGLLDEYRPQAAEGFPEAFRDPDGQWTGLAARGRVLIVNTDLVKPEDIPASLEDLVKKGRERPAWKGKICIARPQAGTTATWVAALLLEDRERAAAGADDGAMTNADALKAIMAELDGRILLSNKTTAVEVGKGTFLMGFTDTDDAVIEKEKGGSPVALVPIASAGGKAMFMPNVVSIVQGAPHRANAEKLVEYILSPAVEKRLAESDSAQIPVNPAVALSEEVATRVPSPRAAPALVVDWMKVGDPAYWAEAQKWAAANIGGE